VLAAIDNAPAYPDFSSALEAHKVVEAMYDSARQHGASVRVGDIVAP